MKDYRRHYHYNEPSSGGFWLLMIGGMIVGAVIPMLFGTTFYRSAFIGGTVGVIIWLIAAYR